MLKKILPHMGKTSLKTRLNILFLISSVVPLLLVWSFVSIFIFNMHQKNTNTVILGELSSLKDNVETIMENMKLVSQQFSNDDKTATDLRAFFENKDVMNVSYVNALKSLKEKISIYEISNPYISNITYFYNDGDTPVKINDSSLIRSALPNEKLLFSFQNQLAYFGPHKTMSIVSDYQVVSMVRRLDIAGVPPVYLYMESGYRHLDSFSTLTLNRMNAIYTVVSDDGNIIYSSNEQRLSPFVKAPKSDGSSVKIDEKKYMLYRIDTDQGWSLQVFAPAENYTEYMNEISFGLILIAFLAVGFSLIMAGVIWKSVNHPFRLFEQNLKKIMSDDIESNIKTINVTEFDKSFEYFGKLKHRILRLVQEAQRQQAEKSQLEVKQLLSKINPHFIHNTLDTLKWYSKQHEYEDVESFVSSLNRLLMYNMEKDKVTTLQSELEAIDDYIVLQKYKYDIEYIKEVDIPLPMLLTELPRFLLQPLVENAIFHGVEGKGIIGIKVELTSMGKICVDVYNEGYPMDVSKMESIISSASDLSTNGIGLQYVVRMLEAKFPNEYDFKICVQNNQNHIKIILPFNKGDYYAKNSDC